MRGVVKIVGLNKINNKLKEIEENLKQSSVSYEFDDMNINITGKDMGTI